MTDAAFHCFAAKVPQLNALQRQTAVQALLAMCGIAARPHHDSDEVSCYPSDDALAPLLASAAAACAGANSSLSSRFSCASGPELPQSAALSTPAVQQSSSGPAEAALAAKLLQLAALRGVQANTEDCATRPRHLRLPAVPAVAPLLLCLQVRCPPEPDAKLQPLFHQSIGSMQLRLLAVCLHMLWCMLLGLDKTMHS